MKQLLHCVILSFPSGMIWMANFHNKHVALYGQPPCQSNLFELWEEERERGERERRRKERETVYSICRKDGGLNKCRGRLVPPVENASTHTDAHI